MICIFIPILLNANGGGIAYYGVNSSGNPYFKEIADVTILREDILIRPEKERISVHATYLLNNHSGQQFHYAFPVDFWISDSESDKDKILSTALENREQYIRNVEFKCNSHKLEYVSEEPQLLEDQYEHNYKMRTWYYTTIILNEGVSELSVSYELQNESSVEYPIMGNSDYNVATFSYDFSPAVTFGNGIIKEFSIVIDANDKAISDMYINYHFEEQGKQYILNTTNFDLKDAEPLFLSFTYNDANTKMLQSNNHAAYFTTQVSSATSRYPESNLSDVDFTTACVICGNKKQIEITSEDGEMKIESVYFLNGNYESEEAYYDNNRIKKAAVAFFDENGKMLLPVDTLEFKDREYKKLSYIDFFEELDCFGNFDYDASYAIDYLDPEYFGEDNFIKVIVTYTEDGLECCTFEVRYAEKAIITILEEYKGAKFDETYISEIFVIGVD